MILFASEDNMSSSVRKGATLSKKGCRFVVWAPHAEEVFVTGTFNNRDKTAHRMERRPDGLWFIDIPGVKAGDEYR